CRAYRTSAFLWDSGPEVVPTSCEQVCRCRAHAGVSNRFDQKRGPKHELVADIGGTHVAAEVHHQSTHRSVRTAGSHPGQRIDVRQQPITQGVEVDQDRLWLGAVRPELVLIRAAGSMHAQYRIE